MHLTQRLLQRRLSQHGPGQSIINVIMGNIPCYLSVNHNHGLPPFSKVLSTNDNTTSGAGTFAQHKGIRGRVIWRPGPPHQACGSVVGGAPEISESVWKIPHTLTDARI